MRIIAFITGTSAIRDILLHLGEPTAPPRIASSLPAAMGAARCCAGRGDPHTQPAPG